MGHSHTTDYLLPDGNPSAKRSIVDLSGPTSSTPFNTSIRQPKFGSPRALLWHQCLKDFEDAIKDLSVEEKYDLREQKAVLLWNQFTACAKKLTDDEFHHQPTLKTQRHLLNHEMDLRRYCDDERLPISNISTQYVSKVIAVSRRIYLLRDTKACA
jgi:hypothetical protein